jgi:Diguanylate cyclase, GGDEF domain
VRTVVPTATVSREIPPRIFANIRTIDKLGRYGGEEFLLILPDTAKDQAVRTLDRLRSIISEVDWTAISGGLNLTMSAGICTVRETDSVDDILTRADAALYRAKVLVVIASLRRSPVYSLPTDPVPAFVELNNSMRCLSEGVLKTVRFAKTGPSSKVTFDPRCRGPCGSHKQASMLVASVNRPLSASSLPRSWCT